MAKSRGVQEHYMRQNIEAAHIIADDPLKYPGIMQKWAELVLGRIEHPVVAEAGPLFRRAAEDEPKGKRKAATNGVGRK